VKNGFDSSSFHTRAAAFRGVASIFFKSGMFTGLRRQIAAIKLESAFLTGFRSEAMQTGMDTPLR